MKYKTIWIILFLHLYYDFAVFVFGGQSMPTLIQAQPDHGTGHIKSIDQMVSEQQYILHIHGSQIYVTYEGAVEILLLFRTQTRSPTFSPADLGLVAYDDGQWNADNWVQAKSDSASAV